MNPDAGKIRVCFIAPKAYPIFNPTVEKVFGGAEVDLYLLATELAKDPGFEVSCIVADYGQPDAEVREGVRLFKSLRFEQNPLAGTIKIWDAMKRTHADIYMHEAASMGTVLAAAFCRRHRRVFVYRTASMRETNGDYFTHKPICGQFVRWAFRSAKAFIVQNEQDARNAASQLGLQAEVIRNALRLSAETQRPKETILWAGRSLSVKRPDLFLELAQAFGQERFVMICQEGTGDAGYRQLIKQAAGIDNLTFIQRVPYQDMPHYFEQAKILVNTSESEGFPNTFLQAAAASAAILTYRVNPDDFLTRHHCGLSSTGDMAKLKENLTYLLEEDRYREFGQYSRRYSETHHDIRHIIDRYKTLFRQAVTQKNNGRMP